MPSIGTVTLNSVVYYPSGKDGGGNFVWVDRTSAYSSGRSLLSQTPFVTKNTNVKRVGFKLDFPTVETDPTVCACPGQPLADSVVTIYIDRDSRSSLTDLTELQARLVSLVSSAGFVAAVENGEGFFA